MLHESDMPFARSESAELASQAAAQHEETALQELVPAAILELDEERTDGPALNGLARGLAPFLVRYIRSRGWGLDDPEGLASEVLARILLHLRMYDPSRSSLLGWVFLTARNAIFDELRNARAENETRETRYEQRRRAKHHLKERPSDEQRAAMMQAIFSLPAGDQYLLHLTMAEKLSATAAGKILGLPAETVRKRKERLLKVLDRSVPAASGNSQLS